MEFTIKSSSFTHEGTIPTKFTCQGDDISPPLSWSDPPEGTMVYALLVDDPDAPDPKHPRPSGWVHWVLYNIPATARGLKEAISRKELPPGTEEGMTDNGNLGYHGPCPPIGRHRYFFRLYALSKKIKGLRVPTRGDLEKKMEGSVLARVQLIGTYEKK